MSFINSTQVFQKWLDWIDEQNSWRFILILYLLRWLIIIPTAFINGWLFPNQGDNALQDFANLNVLRIFLAMLIFNPLIETIVECSLPYWIFHKLGFASKRPWLFIFVSATLMAVLHQTLGTLLPSLITGVFLAYTYGHFSLQSQIKATALTLLFHSCINLVGFTAIVLNVI